MASMGIREAVYYMWQRKQCHTWRLPFNLTQILCQRRSSRRAAEEIDCHGHHHAHNNREECGNWSRDSKFASSWNRRRLVKAAVCCMPELHEENVATKLCNETAKRRYRDFVSRRTMFKAFKTCACTVGEVRRVEKGPLVQALFYAPRLPHTDWSPCWIPVCQEFFISLIFMA